MAKNKIYQPENQFPQAGVVTPKYQKFQQSTESEKTLSNFTSRTEEFVKILPLDEKTVFTARNI